MQNETEPLKGPLTLNLQQIGESLLAMETEVSVPSHPLRSLYSQVLNLTKTAGTELTTQEYQLEKELPKEYSDKLKLFWGKPFWIEDPQQHEEEYDALEGQCCFNHIIGLPYKDFKPKPIFPFQLDLFKKQFRGVTRKSRNLALLKARGIGGTELALRIMAWLCLGSNQFRGSQMMIITGVRLSLARDLMRRMKDMFYARLKILFPYNELTLILNGTRIVSYPSHTISARGQPNVTFMLIDEADFYPRNQQRHVKDLVQGYMFKSHPYVMMMSTAGEPGGIFEQIFTQPEDQCMYDRLLWDVYAAEGTMFTKEDIEFAKLDPLTFDRELLCHFG